MSRHHYRTAGLLLALGLPCSALAQHAHPPQQHVRPQAAEAASTCSPEHAAMGHCRSPANTSAPQAHAAHGCTPEHAAMGHCTPGAPGEQAPRDPIPALTDANRAAAFPMLSQDHMEHGPATYTRVTFNRFEAWDGDDASGQAWEGSASTGGDIHRVWLRSSGSRSAGRTSSANAELRWSRAVARWWDAVAGVRHDFDPGTSRTRAAFGVQGIAPYMFEVSALAYVGDGGGVAAKLEAEYDMRFSNRLVLQPLLELELHSSDDPARLTGSGLSKAEAGLRLRYELTRRFAPYLGIAHERSFGRTARYHEDAGEAARDTRLVAGVRFWF
ncbi:copper resistance protein B [Luteimonas sp. A611]